MASFQNYEISEVLQDEGVTSLYRAIRRSDGLAVILKTLNPARARSGDLDRLRLEYELGRDLEGLGAVKVLDLDQTGPVPVLVFEDFGGLSLDRYLEGPLGTERFLELSLRIVEALAGFHERGIMHKDIKPRNILVNPETLQVKIGDLGIASRFSVERASEFPARIEGALAYLSPEQTGRMNRPIDYRTDFYSLGVTLYEMATGRLPFEARDALGWIHAHIALEPLDPRAVNPAVPEAVSEIILKLLSKEASDRYQSTLGIRHDLERCLSDLRSKGFIEPFALATKDLLDRFRLPQRLYGREKERGELLAAFERVVSSGRPEWILVSGYSGIGKSALVQELHEPVMSRRGFFTSGKFDQFSRDTPHSPLIEIFRNLLDHVLADSEDEIRKWTRAMSEALGANARILVDVLPRLKVFLGDPPPVPELSLNEAQNRFHRVFTRFLRVFARDRHPLVLFLDDLQWADAASLKLLQYIVQDPSVSHLLLIGAYRDNEVDPVHPLLQTLAEVKATGFPLSNLVLTPLDLEDVERLVADTLHGSLFEIRPLARLVYEKTQGNPFFMTQFLAMLHKEGLVFLDRVEERWRWDLGKIQAKGYTDNIVDFMVGRIRLLPAATQSALEAAACVGNKVPLATLAVVTDRTVDQARDDIQRAVEEGLLIPSSGEEHRFLHDRVQQAAYLLIPEDKRAAMHLRIGRLLRAAVPPEFLDESVFDIVNQFNFGSGLLESDEERLQIAELNLRAGRKAKASTAYKAAASYLASGLSLLPAKAWERNYDLAYFLRFERAQCEWMTGNFYKTKHILEELLPKARTDVERAAIYNLNANLHTTMGDIAASAGSSIEGLRLFGIDLSLHPTDQEVRAQVAKVWERLGDKPIEDLLHLPPMRNEKMAAVLKLLSALISPAFFTDGNLLSLLFAHMVNISLEHGNTDVAAVGYAFFGMVIGPVFGKYDEGYRFGKLGYDLVNKNGYLTVKAQVYTGFGDNVNFWTRHLKTDLNYLYDAFDAAVENGDLLWTCFCCDRITVVKLAKGDPLEEVYAESQRRLEIVRQAKFVDVVDIMISLQRFLQNMRGLTAHFSTFSDETFNQEAFESHLTGSRMTTMVCWYWILKLQARFMSGDYAEALESAERARPILWSTMAHLQEPDFYYYHALTLAAVLGKGEYEGGQGKAWRAELDSHRARFEVWARNGPENFENRLFLIDAEIARLDGRDGEAMRLYNEAARSARRHGFVQYEAIAHELAARFHFAKGFDAIGWAHVQEARLCYLRWGADGKVRQLDRLHPALPPSKTGESFSTTFVGRNEQIDLGAVLKSSQTISSEIVPERLQETLLRTVMEAAGAQKGLLLLAFKGEWTVEAEADFAEGPAVRLLPSIPLSAASLPLSLVQYVQRTMEAVILDDASADTLFSSDPYMRNRSPRSVLCLPISRQSRLVGLLYLENNRVRRAFTPASLTVLQLLVAQAAISLENARLYSDLRKENAERRQAEESVRASQERLQAIVDNSAAVIYVKDVEGRYLLVNRRYQTDVGVTQPDVLGKRDCDVLPDEVAAGVMANDRKVIESGNPIEIEETVPMVNGLRTFISVKFPLRDSQGSLYAVCGISTDITERKQAERESRFLSNASRRLALSLDFESTLGVISELPVSELADACWVRLAVSSDIGRSCAAFHLLPERADALTAWLEASSPKLSADCGMGKVLRTGESEVIEELTKNHYAGMALESAAREAFEGFGFHSVLTVPLTMRGQLWGVMMLGAEKGRRPYTASDVPLAEELAYRCAMALESARLYREAQNAARMREEFLSIASHELRTPLTPLRLQVQMLLEMVNTQELASLPPESLKRLLENSNRQLLALTRLLDSLLDVSRLSRGYLSLSVENVDLSELIRDVVEKYRADFVKAGSSLILQVPPGILGNWDRSRVEQVLTNLITNALRYGGGKPVTIEAGVEAARARISVRDEGIGISKEDRDRIFRRFERAVSFRRFGGLGLGLYITKELVTAMGGTIHVVSELGSGSTFTVELPLEARSLTEPEGDERGAAS